MSTHTASAPFGSPRHTVAPSRAIRTTSRFLPLVAGLIVGFAFIAPLAAPAQTRTEAEAKAELERIQSTDQNLKTRRDRLSPEGVMRSLDADGDGKITRDEFMSSNFGKRRPQMFERVDLDSDGFLSTDEIGIAQQLARRADGGSQPTTQAEIQRSYSVASNIPYATMDGVDPERLSLDIYTPTGAVGPFPVVVFVHGGGWSIGDKARVDVKPEYFARRGVMFVSVNYRLSPAVTHPAHVQDMASALVWLRDNLDGYGGDSSRMMVMGHSAGAHIAALVATDASRLAEAGGDTSLISGVVLLDGAAYEVEQQMEATRRLGSKMYVAAFTEDPATQQDASPVLHARAAAESGDAATLPPFLIFHIEQRQDAADQSQMLAEALRAAGGDATVVVAAGESHSSINRAFGMSGDAVAERVDQFLAEELGWSLAAAEPITAENAAPQRTRGAFEPGAEDSQRRGVFGRARPNRAAQQIEDTEMDAKQVDGNQDGSTEQFDADGRTFP